MLKALRTFFIYDFILGILCLIFEKYTDIFPFMMGLVVLSVPSSIAFGTKYAQSVTQNHSISFSHQLLMGIPIFIINYLTYLLPHIKGLLLHERTLIGLSCGTFLPAMLLTAVFYCCIIYPRLTISSKLWGALKPFFAYIFIVTLLKLYHFYVLHLHYNIDSNLIFSLLVKTTLLDVLMPLSFGLLYGKIISQMNLGSLFKKLSISIFIFIVNFLVYYIPYYIPKSQEFIFKDEFLTYATRPHALSATMLLVIVYIISLVMPTFFQNKDYESFL